MYMGNSAQITNGMLYEMIRDFKDDFRSFKTEITARQSEDHQMLMELWKERGKIEVKFSKLLFLAVAALSFIVSLTVAVFVVSVAG